MASLTARLLSTAEITDSGLDDIFKSSAAASSSRVPKTTNGSKRKIDAEVASASVSRKTKSQGHEQLQALTKVEKDRPAKKRKGPKREGSKRLEVGGESAGTTAGTEEGQLPVHISLAQPQSGQPSKPRKVKYVPPNETKDEVDARTIFIGNLPISILKSKASTYRPSFSNDRLMIVCDAKNTSLPPNAKWKVESTRYRSVAFNTSSASSHKPDEEQHTVEVRGKEKEDETPTEYLTANQKKRLAFIKGELHNKAEVTNCYIVLGHHPPPPSSESEQLVQNPDFLHPAEVARLVVRDMDGSMFQDRTIRVDRVGKAKLTDTTVGTSRKEDMKRTVFVGSLTFEATEEDVRAFFEAIVEEERGEVDEDENDGEGVSIESEKEENDGDGDDDDDDEKEQTQEEDWVKAGQKKTWVQSVRVIRDPDTQLGKGIAYVTFRDVECVDEVLALSPEKLSFGRRTLRVQRCKTISGSTAKSKSTPKPTTSESKTKRSKSNANPNATSKATPVPIPSVPKGDPTLGARLSGLSVIDRKEAKSNNADRVARRLAKKKQRVAMGKSSKLNNAGSSSTSAKGGILGKMPKSTNPLKKAKAKKAKR
ncbi:hypothetical protein FRB98_000443 [Tulasnella sp. 332]|nr:hypothetical protein FRB98_000443 [Tulasnella sp. 332]